MPPPTSPLPEALAEGHRRWRAGGLVEQRQLFARLVRDGQQPASMVVQCSDSRVDAVALFDAGPGELFVVRNVANLVPPAAAGDGIAAALAYAVGPLAVRHLIVLGHSDCGGVAACDELCAGAAAAEGPIAGWVGHLRPAWDAVGGDDLAALGREGVLLSLRNLSGYPDVAAAVAAGALTLHGAWVDIASGDLHVAGRDGRFAPM